MSAPAAAPEIVTRYLDAADTQDSAACAACFAPDGFVVDENTTYRGPDEIQAWREETLRRFTYTTTVTGRDAVSDDRYRVHVLVEGNFPGGTVNLTFEFTLVDGLIASLVIAE